MVEGLFLRRSGRDLAPTRVRSAPRSGDEEGTHTLEFDEELLLHPGPSPWLDVTLWARLPDRREVPLRRKLTRLSALGAPPLALPRLAAPGQPPSAREHEWARLAHEELARFLARGAPLDFGGTRAPRVAVLVVLYNRAELTFRCLRSLWLSSVPLELVIVDNASTDHTAALLAKVRGARILRRAVNGGFVPAVNEGVRLVERADALLLLNNDAEVFPGAIEHAMATLESADDVGIVGARFVDLEGRIQEGGSIIWSDGSCASYRRGEDPASAWFLAQRDIDFVSGAFLLTRVADFREYGGFPQAFAPAYGEDVDFNIWMHRQGKRVVYEPRSVISHVEFASSTRPDEALRLQRAHTTLLVERHRDWLQGQLAPNSSVERARFARTVGQRVLVLADTFPAAGDPAPRDRLGELLEELLMLRCRLSLYATRPGASAEAPTGWPPTVEALIDLEGEHLGAYFGEHGGGFDLVVVRGADNLRRLAACTSAVRRPEVVYVSDGPETGVGGAPGSERSLLALPRLVLVPSAGEERAAAQRGGRAVSLLVPRQRAPVSEPHFAQREGFLFAGNLGEEDDAEHQALDWFLAEVAPALRARLGVRALPLLLWRVAPSVSQRLGRSADVAVLSSASSWEEACGRARVAVAPHPRTRGWPELAWRAGAQGLPVVCSPWVLSRLGWTHRREGLLGSSGELFAESCAQLYLHQPTWLELRARALALTTALSLAHGPSSVARHLLER